MKLRLRSYKMGKWGKLIASQDGGVAMRWRTNGWNGTPHHDDVRELFGLSAALVAGHIWRDGRFYFHHEDPEFTAPRDPIMLAQAIENRWGGMHWGGETEEQHEHAEGLVDGHEQRQGV